MSSPKLTALLAWADHHDLSLDEAEINHALAAGLEVRFWHRWCTPEQFRSIKRACGDKLTRNKPPTVWLHGTATFGEYTWRVVYAGLFECKPLEPTNYDCKPVPFSDGTTFDIEELPK